VYGTNVNASIFNEFLANVM